MPPLKFCVYNGFYRIWVSPVSSLRLFIITIRVLLRFLNIRFSMGAHNISLIDCHFVCHHLQLGTTDLPFVSSLLHLADFFTKTHIAARFCFILSKLLVLSTLTPRVCGLASWIHCILWVRCLPNQSYMFTLLRMLAMYTIYFGSLDFLGKKRKIILISWPFHEAEREDLRSFCSCSRPVIPPFIWYLYQFPASFDALCFFYLAGDGIRIEEWNSKTVIGS